MCDIRDFEVIEEILTKNNKDNKENVIFYVGYRAGMWDIELVVFKYRK